MEADHSGFRPRLRLRWKLRGRLRVLLGAHHLDPDEAVISLDPGVVTWRDRVRVAGLYRLPGPVIKLDLEPPGDGITDV